ncbi:hypothetical protein [uncultured Methanobrevibacter sp.]|uniref:hypothetical protein n=1 Tax=uncultured Methanobrevibacter sp. TaxID=253161 RepID=UPI0025D60D82|nr:hypothetical protein [uncultured Methanobrevibacter sp.]
MKFKKSILVISLIIFLLNIATVAASDIEDAIQTNDGSNAILTGESDNALQILSEDISTAEDNVQLKEQTDENEIISSEDSNDIDDGSFTALQKKIDEAEWGSTIILNKDYTYDEGFSNRGIIIDKNLTINGNGHTLNGLSKSRIFLIRFGLILNHQVTLNNIKFTNGYSDLYGGAIFNYANLTVNKCEFTNNYAKYAGGAISSVGYINCKNSKFNKNTAGGDAGALFTLSFENSIDFYRNIYNESIAIGDMEIILPILVNVTIKFTKDNVNSCVFTNNVAKGRGGGAIYAFSHIYIKSSTFTNNKAGEKGGAVFGNKDLYITDSKFTNNKVSKYGGAVYFKCHEQSGQYEGKEWISEVKKYKCVIKTSKFTNCTAAKGGAIYAFKSSSADKHCAKAINCTFTNNKGSPGRDSVGTSRINCVFNYLKLTLSKVTVKKSAKRLIISAKLTKGKSLIKGKKIIFTFNGKRYTAKTNSKGIARIIIRSTVLKKLKVGKAIRYQAKYGKLIAKRTVKVRK